MKIIKKSIKIKSLLGIIMLLILFTAVIIGVVYKGVSEVLLNQYAYSAFLTARTAEELVDADHINELKESGGTTDEYMTVYNAMQELCNSQDATFIYVICPDLTDYGHITFLISTIHDNSPYTHYDFGYYRETTNDEYREKYRALYEGKSDQELVIRDKGYIETDPHITAMIPLKDSKGQTQAILCVQKQMDNLVAARQSVVIKILLIMLALMCLIILAQCTFLEGLLLKPLMKISEEADRFALENKPAEIKLSELVHSEDEVGNLAHSIDQMEEQIDEYVKDLTRITEEKQRTRTELQLASRIQNGMLPDKYPAFPDRPEFDIYGTMDPARDIGGDFFDYFLIDDDHLCMMIADVSGKGIPAALFMMICKIILTSTSTISRSPAEILKRSNNYIYVNNPEEMFVTAWLGILEISTGKLTAANAGHEYPALMQPGNSFELVKDKHGFVLGVMEGTKYTDYELMLEPGARLFVYTDGLPEASDSKNNMFGTDRMLSALNKKKDAPILDMMEEVLLSVSIFVGDEEQFDDLTMVCLEYKG